MCGITELISPNGKASSCSTVTFFLPSVFSFCEYLRVIPSSSAATKIPVSFFQPLNLTSTADPMALMYWPITLNGWSSPAEVTVRE